MIVVFLGSHFRNGALLLLNPRLFRERGDLGCSAMMSSMPGAGEVDQPIQRFPRKVFFSAVACNSTMPPEPVMTTFMSTSAVLSSA